MRTKTVDGIKRNSLMGVARGVLIATVLSLVLVLIHALVVHFFGIGDNTISIVTQVIKGVSVFVGCLFGIRGANNGWLKGFFVGLIYVAITFMIFSALEQSLEVDVSFFNDLVLGAATGLVSGIVSANLGNK